MADEQSSDVNAETSAGLEDGQVEAKEDKLVDNPERQESKARSPLVENLAPHPSETGAMADDGFHVDEAKGPDAATLPQVATRDHPTEKNRGESLHGAESFTGQQDLVEDPGEGKAEAVSAEETTEPREAKATSSSSRDSGGAKASESARMARQDDVPTVEVSPSANVEAAPIGDAADVDQIVKTKEHDSSLDEKEAQAKALERQQTDLRDVSKFLASVEREEEEELFDSLLEGEEELRAASTADVRYDSSKYEAVLKRTKERVSKAGPADSQHLVQFDSLTKEKKLKISSVPKEQVAARLELIRKRQRENREKVRKYFAECESDIVARERAARDRVVKTQLEREHKVEAAREAISANLAELEPRLRRAFIRREEFLRKTLAQQDAKITEVFGVLLQDHSYGARKLLIDTSHKVPRKVAVRVDVLRGIKDKMPRGTYRVGIYVLDELAGARIILSDNPAAQEGAKGPADTLAWSRRFQHNGRFDAFEAEVHDSVMVVCPPRRRTNRSNVFILEVFRCADGDPSAIQSIVGWTALPMLNIEGELCQGRFKLPMLKGAYSGAVDRFYKMESALAKDLDRWLGNMYIHVEPASAAASSDADLGMGLQASMEMDFSRNFESMQANESSADGNNDTDAAALGTGDDPKTSTAPSVDPVNDPDEETAAGQNVTASKVPLLGRLLRFVRQRRGGAIESMGAKQSAGVTPVSASMKAREARKRASRISYTKPSAEELDEYQYALHAAPVSKKAAILHQLEYLREEAANTLRFKRLRVNEGWIMLLLVAAAFYVRMFAHYGGQYMYLRSGGYGAAYAFQILPYKCVIKFSDAHMPLYHLVNMIFAGSFAVLVAFSGVALTSLGAQLVTGHLPSVMHKFVLLLGLMTLTDPVLTILVDSAAGQISCENFCALGKYASDCYCSDTEAWRVIHYFYQREGSVLNAVYLLLLVYSTILGIATLVLALYMVFVHRDGRSHDLYRRLFGAEGVFFVPEDTEVSSAYVELAWHRAVQWKGPRGATREVSTSTHPDRVDLEIVEIARDGSRALWRVFTQLPNGMIVEEPRRRQ